MKKHLRIEEAATYLGVTAQTLRNWDKSGELECVREPGNNYRTYSIDELDRAKNKSRKKIIKSARATLTENTRVRTESDLKRLISRLHNQLRDLESNSSIIERFDELTKILITKINYGNEFSRCMEQDDAYSSRIKDLYVKFSSSLPFDVPKKFSYINMKNDSLAKLCDYITKFELEELPADLKGLAYEEMIKNTFEKGDNQQFFTPKSVVNFMCSLLEPISKGSVCDPASGTGGFLIDLLKNNSNFNDYTAFEIDERLAWVTGINLELHGCKNYKSLFLSNGGSLGPNAKKHADKFDVILTNPPFGSDYSDSLGLQEFAIGKGKTSRRRGVLFIERCLDFLKDGGFLAIIIDEGVLSHPSNEDIRNLILEKGELIGVIGLPETTFMPYASVKASILVIKKNKKPNKSIKTFFAEAEKIGKKPNGDEDYTYSSNGTAILNSDLPEILDKWRNFIKSRAVENSEKIYTTNIFNTYNSDRTGLKRFDFPFHHYSREIVQTTLNYHAEKLIKLSDLCDERNEIINPTKDIPDQTILYTGLAHIESNSEVCHQTHTPANSLKSNVKKYERMDVVFSRMRPNLRKCVYINFKDSGYCSPECSVLSVKKNNGKYVIQPELLAAILRSNFVYGQIVHLVAGIGRPRLSVKDLKNIMIPVPSDENEENCLKIYKNSVSKIHSLNKKVEELMFEIEKLKSSCTNEIVDTIVGGDNANK